jgi:gamma-glutamylaminecyclotransferase
VARLTGLEPATPGVTGRYSNRLSYNRAFADPAQPDGEAVIYARAGAGVKDLRTRDRHPVCRIRAGRRGRNQATMSGVDLAVILFAFGTLKRGFPLHGRGLAGAQYLGNGSTVERLPMLIAGRWYAPMMLNEPGRGLRVEGELFAIGRARLRHLDGLESVGEPGNLRVEIEVEREGSGDICRALAYWRRRCTAAASHTMQTGGSSRRKTGNATASGPTGADRNRS